jgi:hypothetical protein
LIHVHLRPAEIAPVALAATAAVTMIVTVGIGIEIPEIGTTIIETRRRSAIVAA